jgi:hypothetical protein
MPSLFEKLDPEFLGVIDPAVLTDSLASIAGIEVCVQ